MATPILGPIENGVRLLFTISFTVPTNYIASDGNAVITDTLPNGLSLYLNNAPLITDSNNSVKVNDVAVTTGITFSGTTTPVCTITAGNFAAGDNVLVTFDAKISDQNVITADTNITNSSLVSFSLADAGKYNSTGGSLDVQLTGTNNLNLLSPLAISVNLLPTDEEFEYSFTASSNPGTFNYFITDDFGQNLDLKFNGTDPVVSAYYGGNPANAITVTTTPSTSGDQTYTFSFANDAAFLGQVITLKYTATTKNLLSTSVSLIDKLNYSIGGAIGVEKSFTVTITIL